MQVLDVSTNVIDIQWEDDDRKSIDIISKDCSEGKERKDGVTIQYSGFCYAIQPLLSVIGQVLARHLNPRQASNELPRSALTAVGGAGIDGSRRQQENHWMVAHALTTRPIRLLLLPMLGMKFEYRGRLRLEAGALSSCRQLCDITYFVVYPNETLPRR